jgi:hypothetical protein
MRQGDKNDLWFVAREKNRIVRGALEHLPDSKSTSGRARRRGRNGIGKIDRNALAAHLADSEYEPVRVHA